MSSKSKPNHPLLHHFILHFIMARMTPSSQPFRIWIIGPCAAAWCAKRPGMKPEAAAIQPPVADKNPHIKLFDAGSIERTYRVIDSVVLDRKGESQNTGLQRRLMRTDY
jgi:hypothetical protein